MIEILISLLPAYTIFLGGILTPGPANLMIMSVSVEKGKTTGIVLAIGVICGSITWALFAVFGIGALIATYPPSIFMIRLIGAIFLIWLSYKAVKNALKPSQASNKSASKKFNTKEQLKVFLQGYAIHIANPKALIIWTTIISVGVPPDSSFVFPYLILIGCNIMGVFVFIGYAILFSTNKMVSAYRSIRKPINLVVATLFFSLAMFSLSKLF